MAAVRKFLTCLLAAALCLGLLLPTTASAASIYFTAVNETVAVLNALWIWNDYLLPYLILARPATIPLSQMYFYGQYNQQWNLIMAGFVVSTLPVVVFFLCMQKHVINGIAAGAVKG